MNNINDLTQDLKSLYADLRDGKIENKDAKELANVAGKLIKASSLKLEYNRYMGDKSPVDFLESKEK